MRTTGDVNLTYRKYPGDLTPISGNETQTLFGSQIVLTNLPEILDTLNIQNQNDLIHAIQKGQ
jgi:hypothetical protein